MKLRDGSQGSLLADVILEHDPRSLEDYRIGPVAAQKLQGRHWKTYQHFNQGASGQCVMHAIAHERASAPVVCKVSKSQIIEGHRWAQKIDEYPNDGPQFGTSLLACCKFVKAKGWAKAYHWCKNADDVLYSVAYRGPVVAVVDWPGETGLHCVCCTLIAPKSGKIEGPNSWGSESWFKFSFDQFRRIFRQGVIFSGRKC